MTAFLIVMFILFAINVPGYAYYLIQADYPREKTHTDDVIHLITTMVITGWIAYLLWG